MNSENSKENKAWVRFNKEVWFEKRTIPAAEYGKVFFIPKRGVSVPRKKLSLVRFHVYPSFYLDGEAIYSVEIIKSETIEEIRVFRNTYISDCLLKDFNSDETIVMIGDPNPEKGYETFLLRVINHSDNKEIARFIQKSFLDTKVRIKRNGIVEAIIGASGNSYIKNNFLKDLSNLVSELSEA